MMRKFRRIDLTNATEDYFLKVGEEAYISFSNVTQVPLHIATQDGTYYEMHIIPANTGGTTGGNTGTETRLCPNNQLYTNAFKFAYVSGYSGGLDSAYMTYSAFRIGIAFNAITAWICNRTQYKSVRLVMDQYGHYGGWPVIGLIDSLWQDTTTPWTSLGTIVFPQSSSGEILVRRLR